MTPTPEPEVDLDRLPYLLEVESRLVEAARHRPLATPRARRPTVTSVLVVAATVILLALGGGLLDGKGLRPSTALEVPRSDDVITIDVIDASAAPDQVRAELRAVGIAASLLRAAAPPSLDGRLVAIGSEATAEPEGRDLDGDGTIDQVVLPVGFDGTLELVFGDADAGADAMLRVTGPPPGCRDLIDRPVGDVGPALTELSGDITWFRANEDGELETVSGRAEIPDDDVVIELTIDRDGSLWVTATPTPEAIMFPFPESRCG